MTGLFGHLSAREARALEPFNVPSQAESVVESISKAFVKFSETLGDDHELGVSTAGGSAVLVVREVSTIGSFVLVIDGIVEESGERARLIQHVGQLSLLLVAAARIAPPGDKPSIGFSLGAREPHGP